VETHSRTKVDLLFRCTHSTRRLDRDHIHYQILYPQDRTQRSTVSHVSRVLSCQAWQTRSGLQWLRHGVLMRWFRRMVCRSHLLLLYSRHRFRLYQVWAARPVLDMKLSLDPEMRSILCHHFQDHLHQ